MTRPLLALGLVMLATACVAPIAAPPLRIAAAPARSGGALASAPSVADATSGAELPPVGLEVRATVEPLAGFESLANRRGDVGIGYLLFAPTPSLPRTEIHGAILEGAVHLRRFAFGHGFARLSLRAGAEVLVRADGTGGGGVHGSLDLELGRYGRDSFTSRGRSGFATGVYAGETSIGLFVGGSYRRLEDAAGATAQMGLTLRTPAILGVGAGIPNGRSLFSLFR